MFSRLLLVASLLFFIPTVQAACKPGECGGWGQPSKPGEGGNYGGSDGSSGSQRALWGAIALSSSTYKTGIASGFDSLTDASKAAIIDCGVKDCRVIQWEENKCAALAGGTKNAGGVGSGYSANEAIKDAVNMCQSHGSRCKWMAYVCD